MKKILAFLLAAAIILPSLSVPVSAGEVSPEYPIIDYPLNQAGTVVANWDQATQKLTFSPRNGGGIIEREFLYSKENLDDNTPKGLFERIRKNSGAGYDSPPYLDGLGSLYDIQNVTFTFEKDAGLPVDSSYLFSNFKGLITFSPDYDVSHVTNMEGLFQNGYRSVEGTANWDTGNVTNMKKTFYNNYGNSDVSNWDTGKVTTMESMFEWAIYCNPDVSNWDTSQVTTMEKMFYNARSANPNVTNWNTGRVTNMKEMFHNTWTADPDVSNWDTSQVITMESMFSGAGKANPNVRNWNTGQVQNMYCMFFRAPSAQPDVSNWDVSQVQNMGYMFYQMNSLKKVDLRKWQFASNVYTHYMFGLLPALDYIYLPAVHPDIFSGGCFSGDFLQHIDGQEPGPVIYGSSNYYLFKATGSPTLYYMEGSMYPLTVNSGKAMINNYVVTGGFPGNEVTIFANYAPDGQHFKEWQIIKGAVTLTDATAAITSFIMPAEEVEITATYEGNPLIPLGTPTDLAWDADRPGMATWGFVPNAGSYNIKLLKDGEGILNQANFPSVEYDFMAIIEENGAGDYTFMVQAVGDQVAYVDGPWSVLSPVYHYAPTPPTYEIVVNSGNAEPSSAQEGELITITADDAADGQQFKEWQIIKGTITLADATAATTSFTMPAEDVEITATYEDIPVVEYAIIMHQAKALVGGNEVTAAAEGSDVTIVANAAPDGQQFKEWQIIQGAVTLSNATAAAASFIMPAEEVEISATYEDTPLIVLGTPTDLAWDSSTPGMGSWTFVENANSYNIKLFKDGEEIMNETNFPSVEYDFMTIIIENGAGDYTFMVQAFGDGEIYADGPWSELSPVYHYAPVPPTYEINVNHGSAKPSEAPAGENITITADAPPTNQHFKEWIINQGTITLANTNEATTTFIMPAENVEVTATYEQNEPTSLAAPTDLAWDSSIPGRGSWTFVDNANGYNIQLLKDDEEIMNETNFPSVEYDFMAIIAENGAGDYTFIVQAIGDGVIYDDSPWSEPSPVYHYAPAPPTYEINVNYGSAEPSEAPAGETITITADAPPANQHFKEWIINQGTVTLANANEATTTFIMPAENVEVTATYEQNEPTQLAAPTGLAWDTTIPGKAIWTAVPNAIGYHIALFKDGQKITDDSNHPSTEYDFTEYIEYAGAGDYTFVVMAAGDGVIYADSPLSELSPVYHYAPAPPTYEINVNYGSAEPSEAPAGETITITADAPPANQHFKEWIINQGTITLANANEATTTFIMPAENVELTATYEQNEPIQLAAPTGLAWDTTIPGKATWTAVSNAIGYHIALFKDGQKITDDSNHPSTEYDFTEYIEYAGAGDYTFVVMAAGDGVIYADSPLSELSPVYHYAPVPPTYEINVNYGSAEPSEAPAGETITITADAPPANQHFKEWIINQGTVTLANANEATTTFIMPAENVEVTATYEQNEPTPLAAPTDLAWDSSIPGRGSWTFVDNANGYNIKLLKDGEEIMNEINFPSVEYDFMAIIAENGAGDYTFIVQAIGDGVIYDDSPWSEPSPVYHYAPTYEINVNHGSAEPSEAKAGDLVTITADAPPANQHFKEWIINQGTVTLANTNEATTTFIMPAENVEVTATYENDPIKLPEPEGLTWDETILGKAKWLPVEHAIGYHVILRKDGQTIMIEENITETSYDFTSAIVNAGDGDYTFIVQAIGDKIVYIDSDFSDQSPIYHYARLFEIIVNYGSAEPSEAKAGDLVTITADAPPANQHFKEWIINQGTITLANANETTTTFIMPAENVELTATYEQNEPIKLGTPSDLAWDTTIPGKATWTAVPNAGSYRIKLLKNCKEISNENNVPSTEFDFTQIIAENGAGAYAFKVQAVGDGVVYADGDWSELSPVYNYAPVIPTYEITVHHGSAQPETAKAGDLVTIKANKAPLGKKFKTWVVNKGNVVLENAAAQTTSFIMPAENVELTAVYEKKPPKVITITIYLKPFGKITLTITIDAQTAEEIEQMINDIKAKIAWIKKIFKVKKIHWQW